MTKGVDMKKGLIIANLPEHCRDCDFYGIRCKITGEMCKYYNEDGRPEGCPILELPNYIHEGNTAYQNGHNELLEKILEKCL